MIEFDAFEEIGQVIFSPSTEVAEVIQNVRTILKTRKGTVPLDRGFGIDWSFIDKPLPLAQAALATEVIKALKKYEPRAVVLQVGFNNQITDSADGKLSPRVIVGIQL